MERRNRTFITPRKPPALPRNPVPISAHTRAMCRRGRFEGGLRVRMRVRAHACACACVRVRMRTEVQYAAHHARREACGNQNQSGRMSDPFPPAVTSTAGRSYNTCSDRSDRV